ncbi:MAG: hypothetical protein HC800_03685 [Phormidesmis sp. RL_2_1]|nr:hypothetical protein [Phormidesmis sp. RL_2_1]
MLSDALYEQIKSKDYCRNCEAKKLDNDSLAKDGNTVFHHCLNCGFEYWDTEAEKKYYQKYHKDSDKKTGDDQPWGAGSIIFLLMLVTILAITLVEREEDPAILEPVSQLGISAGIASTGIASPGIAS